VQLTGWRLPCSFFGSRARSVPLEALRLSPGALSLPTPHPTMLFQNFMGEPWLGEMICTFFDAQSASFVGSSVDEVTVADVLRDSPDLCCAPQPSVRQVRHMESHVVTWAIIAIQRMML
jgi:hypothetical protein